MEVRVNMTQLFQSMSAALSPTQAREVARAVLPGLSSAALQYWKKLAQTELRSSSRDYVAGVQLIEKDEETHEIVLTGMLPNMVENGWPGGDMRTWMLRSPKAKTAKDGSKYMSIPFRHGTPGTGGRNVGNEMPAAIHKSAKKLSATLTSPHSGRTLWGERLSLGTARSKEARDILQTKKSPWHTTSIFTGMIRNEKTYDSATQSSYFTFRTISTKSRDPRSWMHPGIAPKHFAERTTQHLETIVAGVVAQVVGGSR